MTKMPLNRPDHQMEGRSPRLLRLRKVIQMTSMSRSAIYGLMAAGAFPRPIRVGARSVRWFESEVIAFIKSRPRAGSDGSRGDR